MSSLSRKIVYMALFCVGIAFFSIVAGALFDFHQETLPMNLTAVELGDTRPLHKYGDIYLGGQPAKADFDVLKQQGIATIINLRLASEIDWDEAALAEKYGMQYVHLPFHSSEELTDELFDEALATLKNQDGEKTLVHCAASYRVGAIWYAYRVLEENASSEEAEREAIAVGIRPGALLDTAKDFVERRQNGK